MVATGAQQSDQFERFISKSHPNIHLSSGLWPRYLRGDVIPNGSLERHKANLVFRLERIRPGTAEIFYHPMWELFNFDKLLGPRELRTLYVTMGKSVWRPFLDHVCNPDESPNFERTPFWKKSEDPELLVNALSQIGGLDGVAACLIEARMAYLAQNEAVFLITMMEAYSHLGALATTPEFEFPKEQSALLLMQTICLGVPSSLLPHLGSEAPGDTLCELFQSRHIAWRRRALEHAKSLPKPWAAQFKKWTNEVIKRTYLW